MSHHEHWLSLQQVMEFTGWDRSTVFRKQSSGALKTKQTDEKSANGKPVVVYALSSLPAGAQKNFLSALVKENALVLASRSAHPIKPKYLPPSNEERLLLTSDEQRQQAEYRFGVISPLIDFANNTNGHKPSYRTPAGDVLTTLSQLVVYVAKLHRVSQPTVWNWWKRFNEGKYPALADRPRKDIDQSRFFADHPEAADFVQGKYLSPREKLSITHIHRALVREWARFQKSAADETPSYETVRLYIENLKKKNSLIVAVARETESVYKNEYAPFLLRKPSALHVNQVWMADHVIHDVFCYNDDNYFPSLENNVAFRPWLTAIQDMRSRRIVGLAWCATPSSLTIYSAMHIAFREFGCPKIFYIDNGKDFKKVFRTAPPRLDGEVESFVKSLHIDPQYATPRHPQSKGELESFFKTMHQQFDVLVRPGYSGTSPKTRPEECDQARKTHQDLLKEGADLARSPLKPVSEFIQTAAAWFDQYNNTHPHSGEGMKGRAPAQIYDAELPPEKRSPVDISGLAPLLWNRQQLTVREGGTVKTGNTVYEPADADSRLALMNRIHGEVLVARDPLNPGEAIALDEQNRLLGRLCAQELLVHGASDEQTREAIKQQIRARHKIYSISRIFVHANHHRRRLAGDLTEFEVLSKRAAVSTGQPNVHKALPALKAVNAPAPDSRMHADDIAGLIQEE